MADVTTSAGEASSSGRTDDTEKPTVVLVIGEITLNWLKYLADCC